MYGIKKGDVAEVKALCSPPRSVVQVLSATMTLLGEVNPGDFRNIKRVLAHSTFLQRVTTLDTDSISPEVAVKARGYVEGITEEQITKVCLASTSFFRWVRDVLAAVAKRTGDLPEAAKKEPAS
ncbi:uncharacterized protein LOC117345207 [Pecten maximus]|uniref:uncharacterized protein LOC117345207 n=1 Tax=Pecten maximus TaxID=6579 RepID=UPI00145898D8|nr:uncharacterized protein LOC117345207 [Pecten maximus]